MLLGVNLYTLGMSQVIGICCYPRWPLKPLLTINANKWIMMGILIGYAKRWLSVGVLPTPKVLKWRLATPDRPIIWLEGWGFEPRGTNLTSRKGKGLETEFHCVVHDSISMPTQSSLIKHSAELLKLAILHVRTTVHRPGEEWTPLSSMRTWKLEFGALSVPDSAPCISSFSWFQFFTLCCNKIVIVHTVLSWVLRVILPNYHISGSCGDLCVWSQLIWSEGSSGIPQASGWCQKFWADLATWKTVPFTLSWRGWT